MIRVPIESRKLEVVVSTTVKTKDIVYVRTLGD